MKYSLKNFLIIMILSSLVVSCRPSKAKMTILKNKSFQEKYQNGILYVSIIEDLPDGTHHIVDINTKASIYQKYSLTTISDDVILLASSDIGYRIINKTILGVWHVFDAQQYTNKNVTLYSVEVGNIKQTPDGTMCDRIELFYIDETKVAVYTLMGMFPTSKKFISFISKDSFFVYNGKTDVELKIIDGDIVLVGYKNFEQELL